MPKPTYYVLRFYRNVASDHADNSEGEPRGVVENVIGEQFPFHTMQELWDVLENENRWNSPTTRCSSNGPRQPR